jgi:uncharacterized protein (DUF1810 family)
MPEPDRFDLDRFVAAQDENGTYDRALREVERGQKVTHWMWFVYPQLIGLGDSSMSRRYAISGLDEAGSYLRHPVLGPRLRACARAAAAIDVGAIERAFGPIDARKLRSSMTLFELADPSEQVFEDVLDRHFAGARDPATRSRLPWSDRPIIEAYDDDAAFLEWLAPPDDPRWREYLSLDLAAPRFYATDAFDRWHELSCDLGLVQIFDWGEWSASWFRPRDALTLAALSLADALRVFTWICRSDRTNKGTIDRALDEGQLAALVGVVERYVSSGGRDIGPVDGDRRGRP